MKTNIKLIFLLSLFFLFVQHTLIGSNKDSLLLVIQQSKDVDEVVSTYSDLIALVLDDGDKDAQSYIDALMEFSTENHSDLGKAYSLAFEASKNITQGNYQIAIDLYDEAIPLIKNTESADNQILYYINQSICYGNMGYYEQSIEVCDQAKKIAQHIDDPEWKADIYKRLSEIYGFYLSDTEKAIEYSNLAIDIYSSNNNHISLFLAIIAKSQIIADIDLNKAHDLLIEAEEIINNNNLQIRYQSILNSHIALVLEKKGQIGKSIEYIMQNIEINKKLNNFDLIIDSYLRLGSLHETLYNYDQSLELYKESLEIAKNKNFIEKEVAILSYIATLHSMQEDHNKSLEVYLNAYDISKENGYEYFTTELLNIIGHNYVELDDFENAEKYLNLYKINSSPSEYSAVNYKSGMGHIYYKRNKFAQAKPNLIEAYDFYNINNNLSSKKNIAKILTDIYSKENNFKQAYKWQSIYREVQDSLNIRENQSKITAMQMSLEFEKEKEVISLVNEKEKIELASQRDKALMGGALLLLLALTGLGLYFYIRNKNKVIAGQNKRLFELNNIKDTMFQIIGHDLKKPAIAFRGVAKNIEYLTNKGDTERLKKLGKELDNDASRFYILTDNLLNWAANQKDLLPIKPIEVNLEQVVKENLDLFESVVSSKNITIENKIDNDIIVKTDVDAITTITRNLLDNALKYTNEGDSIIISSHSIDGNVTLKVEDTGIGMDKNTINNLLNKDYVMSRAGTNKEKGSGLGFNIIKNLIQKLDGKLSIESELGVGSVFEIRLPKVA